MNEAPYDNRNAEDYERITQRINDALTELENNHKIAATEKNLARLAECSRGTLRNRVQPLIKLKLIKQARASGKRASRTIKNDNDIDTGVGLKERLRLSRNEISVWVNKFKDLEIEHKKLLRINTLALAEIENLALTNGALNDQLRQCREELAKLENQNKIVQFHDHRGK